MMNSLGQDFIVLSGGDVNGLVVDEQTPANIAQIRMYFNAYKRVMELVMSGFSDHAASRISDGSCFDSSVQHEVGQFLTPFCADRQQYGYDKDSFVTNIPNRSSIDGRHHYTTSEYEFARLGCSKVPDIALSSIVVSVEMMRYAREMVKERCAEIEDHAHESFSAGVKPHMITNSILPAIYIFLREAAMQQPCYCESDESDIQSIFDCEAMQCTLQSDEYMEHIYANAINFLTVGGFFVRRHHQSHLRKWKSGMPESIKIKCPGKEFMVENWNLFFLAFKSIRDRKNEGAVMQLLEKIAKKR